MDSYTNSCRSICISPSQTVTNHVEGLLSCVDVLNQLVSGCTVLVYFVLFSDHISVLPTFFDDTSPSFSIF